MNILHQNNYFVNQSLYLNFMNEINHLHVIHCTSLTTPSKLKRFKEIMDLLGELISTKEQVLVIYVVKVSSRKNK